MMEKDPLETDVRERVWALAEGLEPVNVALDPGAQGALAVDADLVFALLAEAADGWELPATNMGRKCIPTPAKI